MKLRQIATQAGIDVPIYTRTGWPSPSTPMPFGQVLPLYGAYAEGFWDRQITAMPGRYWACFHFSNLRDDSNIANELLGRRTTTDQADVAMYPYLTCEVGGGMMSSYHRRVLINPADIESLALVKLGSGSSLLGYYMYHGGINPDGRLTTLMESQDTRYTNYNDMPIKNYDFQAPIGQYDQIRPHYHLLRRLHLFIHDFGGELLRMPVHLPQIRPNGPNDLTALRWAVRSNGKTGFVFINNYQRLSPMSARPSVQFELTLPDGSLLIPDMPVAIPADQYLIWPFIWTLPVGLGSYGQLPSRYARLKMTTAMSSSLLPQMVRQSGPVCPKASILRHLVDFEKVGNMQVIRDIRPGRAPSTERRPSWGCWSGFTGPSRRKRCTGDCMTVPPMPGPVLKSFADGTTRSVRTGR